MEITWYGLSCFRLREGGITVVCDPFNKKATGLSMPRIKADIVTISHDRPGHGYSRAVTGDPKVISGPGDFEVRGVLINGLMTYHQEEKNQEPERNVAFFFDFDGFIVGHLGDIGQLLQQRQVEDLGEIDVLLVPVSGMKMLDTSRVSEVISLLEPRIVIPMHYQHEGLKKGLADELDSVDKFLKEFGVSEPEKAETLKVTKSALPEETQVLLLEPAGS